jgi:hypothetical protein
MVVPVSLPLIVFASDDFESDNNGWDTATSTSGNFGTGEMLGQLGNSNGHCIITYGQIGDT